jgi:FkbM family methyltransferase
VRRVASELSRLLWVARIVSDPASFRNFRRAERGRFGPVGEPMPVRIRQLGGDEVLLRPGASDAQMTLETFRNLPHDPPPDVAARGIRHVVDLGANIGITVAHNAFRFRDARLLAVELDPANTELCRRNVAQWRDRVDILQGAVWVEDGEVEFVREPGMEYGFYVSPGHTGADRTRAYSMDTILGHLSDGAPIDWMKMDVEGVEPRLLSGPSASWAERVRAIGVQVHGDYTLEHCAADLRALGFEIRRFDRVNAYVKAARPGHVTPS